MQKRLSNKTIQEREYELETKDIHNIDTQSTHNINKAKEWWSLMSAAYKLRTHQRTPQLHIIIP